jgi:hypothetical protein
VKIIWQPTDDTGRSGLAAVVEQYDAVPPISKLLFDGAPRLLTAERMGAAAALAFGRFSSGSVVLPRPVAPALAQAIQDYCAGSWTVVSPVVFEPAALPVGASTFVLGAPPEFRPDNEWGRPRQFKLDIRRADAYAGQLASMDELIIASNAYLHAATDDVTDIGHFLGDLAVAVLFSESLQVDSIALPHTVDLGSAASQKIQNILAACRLGLTSQEDPTAA